ncbi:MAG: hypothetical protein ACREEP_02175 [Dongiaceae bacterium]
MWIMVGGPYGTGAKSAADRAANLARMNAAALAVFRKGHVPIIGVNMALPVIAAASGDAASEAAIMMPLSLALAERCDAFLRIGGRSVGADQEMERFVAAGKTAFRRLEDVPQAAADRSVLHS